MPMHHSKPDGPMPPDVKANLTAAGFTDADIDDFLKDVRVAHQQLEQIEKEKIKTTPTTTPTTPSI